MAALPASLVLVLKEPCTVICHLPPLSLLLMPGWSPWSAAQQMAFFQCSSVGRVPSTALGIPSCYRHTFWLQHKKEPGQFAVCKLPNSKKEIYMVNWHFQCAVTLCPSSQVHWDSVQCILHWSGDGRCHAILEGSSGCAHHTRAFELPLETAWSHQHSTTAGLGVKKCSAWHSISEGCQGSWPLTQFVLMRLIPNDLFAQQYLGVRLVQVGKPLQSRVLSWKPETLTPPWEAEEDAEVTEDIRCVLCLESKLSQSGCVLELKWESSFTSSSSAVALSPFLLGLESRYFCVQATLLKSTKQIAKSIKIILQ